MLFDRRGFLQGAGCAVVAGCGGWAWGGEGGRQGVGWMEAFRAQGFEPMERGNSTFVVCGDVHYPEFSNHFKSQIAAWNAMQPAPMFVALLGDNVCSVSRSFGHKPTDPKAIERAKGEIEGFRDEVAALRRDIPLKLVIGNHDSWPGEVDAQYFLSFFPGMKAYSAFEAGGVSFQIWNGGHDGSIDPAQRAWIREECAKAGRDKNMVVMVHQPSLQASVRERGIPSVVREVFAEHKGSIWLLAGHEHRNDTKQFKLPNTRINQVIHTRSVDGYWVYGVKKGAIVARVFCPVDRVAQGVALPDPTKPPALIRVPFEGRSDLLWSMLIGEGGVGSEEAFVSGSGGNCHTWWFYVKELVYKLPLRKYGKGARHFVVLAALSKHRKTGEPVTIHASGDGESWVETPIVESRQNTEHLFAIPEGLLGVEEIYVRVSSFGYGADTCVGGFGLCR